MKRVLLTGAGAGRATRPLWVPENWADGYVDNRGRFRVYRPDCPRSYEGGYALRAHVIYWLRTGKVHPAGSNLHHVNGDKLDDRYENLQVIEHGQHSRLHNAKPQDFTCEHCGDVFTLSGREVGRRRSEGNTPKFCSQRCYHAHPRSQVTRSRASASLKRKYAEGWRS